MNAILQHGPGEPETLYLGEAPSPVCGPEQVRIAVRATAVNRADVLQRRGNYPPPPGTTAILGLEAAGVISELGPGTPPGLHLGQRVMALLAGGGYAQEVVVPYGQVMPVPASLSDEEAAAIPEVFLTAYLNLVCLAGLRLREPVAAAAARIPGPDEPRLPGPGPGSGSDDPSPQTVLIHGGASGVGTAALRLCAAAGAVAYCTVGSDDRARSCRELGAAMAWNYHATDYVPGVLSATGQRGVDVILDPIGASYLSRNLRALAPDGRLVVIGTMGGNRAELDLALLLSRRIQIIGSTLRPLPLERKAALVHKFCRNVLPLFESGKLRPIVDRVLPLEEAAAAHRALDQHHVGKIVLRVSQ